MFDKDFYPTPAQVIALMLAGLKLNGKTVLEPSAGRADIVKACQAAGANVIACEKHPELKKIVASYCPVIADDFLTLTAEKISHIDFIIMNPPFSADERHILHAWEIAPEGCQIRALCNLNSLIKSENSSVRRQLKTLLNTQGTFTDLGQAFSTADRATGVEVALIELTKPTAGQSTEFEGFFMDEDAEANPETAGLMPYNSVRDLVHRYITAVKIFDEQLTTAVKLNQVTAGWHNIEIAFTCTNSEYDNNRERFKKSLQKSAWAHIFKTLNMEKIATRGLREDINKFVEKQSHLPFTMKNIYRMLEIVIGTTGQRMEKALCEVFDRITTHYHENRYNLEGWKTNSHYLLNRKFIIPRICAQDKYHFHVTGNKLCNIYGGNFELIEDLQKALCWVTGQDYEKQLTLSNTLRNHYLITNERGEPATLPGKPLYETAYTSNEYTAEHIVTEGAKLGYNYKYTHTVKEYGTWYTWGFFRVKLFKKGTAHFEFIDSTVWELFNKRIAQAKGYPLYEKAPTTAQPKQGKAKTTQAAHTPGKVLFSINKPGAQN